MSRFPNVPIEEPLAAESIDRDGDFFWDEDAGKTETSAPLSTRKGRRSRRQKTVRAPSWLMEETEETVGEVPGVVTDPRPARFPREDVDLAAEDE